MKNGHMVGLLVGVGVIVIGFYWTFMRNRTIAESQEGIYTIGILQTASHPALDAVRQGFIDEIQSRVGKKINFVVNNGQGVISTIHAMAQQFHAKSDIDGIFAIATPAAQAMISVEKEKPIGVAAVSVSPAVSQIFDQKNVYGASDMINVRAEIDALHALLPDAKAVGIVFCTAEINSVAMVDIMKKELSARGLESVLIGITSEAELEAALTSAVRKVDVLLAPTDNMVANTISLIITLADRANKPVVVSDNMLVRYGALMARGVDYYQSGRQVGAQAAQIFCEGKMPHDFSIVAADTKEIFVNKMVAQRYGIVIPHAIEKDVVLVE